MGALLQPCLFQDLCHYINIAPSPFLPVCLYSPMLISQTSGTSTESTADQNASLLQAERDSTLIIWLLIEMDNMQGHVPVTP